MNVKLITRALHTLSLLSDEDYEMVLKFRALNEDERGLLITVLEPSKPAGKKASKKSSKSSPSSFKSPRATGIEQQLSKRREQGREAQGDITVPLAGVETQGETGNVRASRDYESPDRCSFVRDDGKRCLLLSDHNVHHMKSVYGYHPFVSVSDAPDAPAPSPANGGTGAGTQAEVINMALQAGCVHECLVEGAERCVVGWPDGSCGGRRQGEWSPQQAREEAANSEASAASVHAATGGSNE